MTTIPQEAIEAAAKAMADRRDIAGADDPAVGWRCGARQRHIGPDVQDCDWPVCGCDPYASKVLEAIAESGFTIVKAGAPAEPAAYITKAALSQFAQGTEPEAHVLLRSGSDLRVALYTTPPDHGGREAIAEALDAQTEMVERVARASFAKFCERNKLSFVFEDMSDEEREFAMDHAKACIKAMRGAALDVGKVTGPIASLPGSRHALPDGSVCDRHPQCPAVARIQGETDSFGSEMIDMCQACLDEHRAWHRSDAARSGTCDWCKSDRTDLRPKRDIDEGMAGPVYRVCGACAKRQDDEIMADTEFDFDE